MTHPNADMVAGLFAASNKHDHNAIADCYDESATFEDIASPLEEGIKSMRCGRWFVHPLHLRKEFRPTSLFQSERYRQRTLLGVRLLLMII